MWIELVTVDRNLSAKRFPNLFVCSLIRRKVVFQIELMINFMNRRDSISLNSGNRKRLVKNDHHLT